MKPAPQRLLARRRNTSGGTLGRSWHGSACRSALGSRQQCCPHLGSSGVLLPPGSRCSPSPVWGGSPHSPLISWGTALHASSLLRDLGWLRGKSQLTGGDMVPVVFFGQRSGNPCVSRQLTTLLGVPCNGDQTETQLWGGTEGRQGAKTSSYPRTCCLLCWFSPPLGVLVNLLICLSAFHSLDPTFHFLGRVAVVAWSFLPLSAQRGIPGLLERGAAPRG